MNNYSYSSHSGSQNTQSLSSSTDPSRYQHPLSTADMTLQYPSSSHAGEYHTQGYPAPQATYQHPSQYAAMNAGQSPYGQAQQHAQYAQMPTGQRSGYAPVPGHTLRDLPFTNVLPSNVQSGQAGLGAMAYSSSPSPSHPSYGGQSYLPMGTSPQYAVAGAGDRHSVQQQQRTHYIPTPAQTLQYAAPSRGAASANSIAIPPPSSPSPGVERYPCDKCDRTFSRPHDRKRHYESQHMQTSHTCQYCKKEFSRADSLKRHLDNGCNGMPSI